MRLETCFESDFNTTECSGEVRILQNLLTFVNTEHLVLSHTSVSEQSYVR